MAFVRTPSYIKNTIMALIKHLLDKSATFAIQTILEPCCNIAATVEFTCVDEEVATATITFTGLPELIDPVLLVYTESNLVIGYDLPIVNGVANISYIDTSQDLGSGLKFVITSATNSEGVKGVYLTTIARITSPHC